MKLITENLEQALFQEINRSTESIMIISPFISRYTAEKLVKKVQESNLKCTIITRFDRSLFVNGASSIEALGLLIQKGISIFALQNLHSKLYIFDEEKCMMGSANFTKKGLLENKEMLIFLGEPSEALPLLDYGKGLLQDILKDGSWQIDKSMIDIEIEMKKHLKSSVEQDPRLTYSWGAKLLTNNDLDEEEIVLSVPIGGTYDIVEKYDIHAHPYNYPYKTKMKYLTFRYPNGGQMKCVYEIVETLVIDMSNWNRIIEEKNFSEDVKERLINYIFDRQKGFDYEKDVPYKHYILSEKYKLSNTPKPPKNNPGGWYYRLGDLLNAETFVDTVKA